jgi:hypothetical protein
LGPSLGTEQVELPDDGHAQEFAILIDQLQHAAKDGQLTVDHPVGRLLPLAPLGGIG